MEKIQETKDKLLEAAAKVFGEKGYEKAKVSDIVAMADVAQGTFYLYFKSKEECLNTMSIDLIGCFLDELRKEEENLDEKSIYRVADSVITTMDRYRDMLRITHFEQGRLNAKTMELHQSMHHEAIEITMKAMHAAGYEGREAELKIKMIDAALMHYLLDDILSMAHFSKVDKQYTCDLIKAILEEVHI